MLAKQIKTYIHPQSMSHFEVKGQLGANLKEIMLISNYNFNRENDKASTMND